MAALITDAVYTAKDFVVYDVNGANTSTISNIDLGEFQVSKIVVDIATSTIKVLITDENGNPTVMRPYASGITINDGTNTATVDEVDNSSYSYYGINADVAATLLADIAAIDFASV